MNYVTYKQLRTNLISRMETTLALLLQTESAVPQLAALATAAYRWASLSLNWSQLRLTESFTVTNGLAEIPTERIGFVKCYTADPRPPTSLAAPISILSADSSGLWLDTTSTTAYAVYDPYPAQFTTTAWDNTASYVAGDLVYDDLTGDCYLAKAAVSPGTALSDTTKWTRQRIWSVLAEPIILYVLAELQSNQAEQAQLQILRAKADDALESAYIQNQIQPVYT